MDAEAKRITPPKWRTRRQFRTVIAAICVTLILAILALGAIPARLLRSIIASELQGTYDREVEIGGISRDSLFSFSPVITIQNIRVAQPAWVGKGDFLRLKSMSARVNMFNIIIGGAGPDRDRKSTRLNSSHVRISYAVLCLKKKIKKHQVSDRPR